MYSNMQQQTSPDRNSCSADRSLQALGEDLYIFLSEQFPVSCASDEFFFFPQIPAKEESGMKWDCFDPDNINEVIQKLSTYESQLELLKANELYTQQQIDVALLGKVVSSIRFQLSDIRFWKIQPTLYLTMACIGLAEAMESGVPEYRIERASRLKGFLDQAVKNLENVPILFRDIGLEMIDDFKDYLISLENELPEIRNAFPSLDRFKDKLLGIPTYESFRLPEELLEYILDYHSGGMKDASEINDLLEQEIEDMRIIMEKEGQALIRKYHHPNISVRSWKNILNFIPVPNLEKIDFLRFYDNEVNRLYQHCLNKGIIPDLISSNSLKLVAMPSYLRAIRTASSYSISPGQVPLTGTFYINNPDKSEIKKSERYREYKMLTAHETYPGHHLLDISRWNMVRSLRRPVEQPVFYEGWACFAEELLRLTGYFSTPEERFLLAKRRLWRAVRGKVDLGMQKGTMDINAAVGYLEETGVYGKHAVSVVKKYLLNPGYQLCYTLGVRRFLDLFSRFGLNNLQKFVKITLTQGEIGFPALGKVMESTDL